MKTFQYDPRILAHAIHSSGPRLLEIVEAARAKPLIRYNLRPGRLFGNIKGNERYKVLELSGNTVFFKDVTKDKVDYVNVDKLLELWNLKGIVEISPIDEIINTLKKYLTPFLGGLLVSGLISWLMKKLG